ncbi:biotin transporter BioY [Deinococcus peraridilitoris]|uniref:Biotin transporter n=1 Tax=Deinococcus peraridilitoris (strain DSM 19664 / LMG 22246 / CIP 109416 / KR-200) TaxID=937777 RepID=L0A092_DEIPD|nr:biotin transporter BioY [Deinococcus peraridilitoris]AFZ67256.1 hypothetical protein Deipe_1737 [Deinococcus peraridilitoris DSM 19664]
MNKTLTYPTLAQALSPEASLARDTLLVLGGAALIALCARIEVPLWPVPVTLQTLAVLLAGAALGSRRGLLAVLAYLGAGALGLPVLAGGAAGLTKLLGPTGGYLLGFAVAAYTVGWLVERFALDRRVLGAAGAMLLGNVVIYALGLMWLGRVTGLSGQALLNAGLTPFLLGDALKLLLAALLLPGVWRWLRR